MTARQIAPATGKLGVLLPGMGAVASTFIAGVMAARKGIHPPIGSLTQMANIRLGKREENRNPLIRDFVPLASLDDLVFGGWDPISPNAMEAAKTAGVLQGSDLDAVSQEMEAIVPMDAVFDQRWVSRLEGVRVKDIPNKWDQAMALIDDIARFKAENGCDRLVMVWCGSTEAYQEPSAVHASVASFEQGLQGQRRQHRAEPDLRLRRAPVRRPVRQRCAQSDDRPRLHDRALEAARGADRRQGLQDRPDAHEDDPGPRAEGPHARPARLVLDQHPRQPRRRGARRPENFKTKEASKLGVLGGILQPEVYPDLYGNIDHVVRINYYPPRGDNKEGWDAIDIFGWLGYEMQIKVDFLCRDSILAAPIVLDLALFMDLAHRAGESGVQEWLSFYLKAPQAAGESPAEHDLFIQQTKLKNTLREWMGEEPVTHSEAG
jgi:myo-inositol-1-phosphate synthase